jgi:cytoskeletal protein CcmA (bactofilin family)
VEQGQLLPPLRAIELNEDDAICPPVLVSAMTTIGPYAAFSGDLTSDEDLSIEGQFDGYVHVRNALLTIAASGRVTADIRGSRVFVRGTVNGSIVASERIELAAGAHVNGSLSANHVVIADGACFNGYIDMGQRTIAARLSQYKAAHSSEPVPR